MTEVWKEVSLVPFLSPFLFRSLDFFSFSSDLLIFFLILNLNLIVTYFRLTQPTSTPSKSLSSTVASRANSSIGNYPDSSSNYGNLESSTNSLRPPSSFSTNSSVAGRRGRRSSSTDGRVDAGAGGGEGKRRGLFVRPNQVSLSETFSSAEVVLISGCFRSFMFFRIQ